MNRRGFLKIGALFVIAGAAFLMFRKWLRIPGSRKATVWQLDPAKCVQCGRCATACVMKESAVKCVHQYAACGYCDFCSGYYHDSRRKFDTAAENQRCPFGAIKRTFIEDPYFEYKIDERLCVGCGKCVKGCGDFGNGSLILQVRRDRCKDCNECAIARVCPSNAFRRVPVDSPYIFKGG